MPKKRKLNARQPQRPPPPQAAKKQQQQKPKPKPHRQEQHEQPTIPFDPHDRILLIGEGDLSFAASLVRHHACSNLVATVLEKSEAELLNKYPHAAANIAAITSPPAPDSEDEQDEQDEQEEEYDEEGEQKEKQQRKTSSYNNNNNNNNNNKIVYGIDATKPLPASTSRPLPNRIIFNFPHVGGKSTDVNRQVRHNQSLLVSFFTRAVLPALSRGGTVVVTLFEAEPYTLWNVRDLARHAGLQVERSFRFQWGAYPGYHHARTLGVVRARDGAEGGGWKGEERAARSYVFMRKGEVPALPQGRRKRRRHDDSDGE